MNIIKSHSIPFREVMRDLAVEMGTGFTQSCEEYMLEIPESVGKGIIRGINFDEGIGLMMYDCLFYEDTEIHFIINSVHPLKFMFCEKGGFYHRFENVKKDKYVNELQNIIVASNKKQGHILKFKANIHTKINNLEIDRERFYQSHSCEISRLSPDLQKLFTDTSGTQMFYHQGNYSLRTAKAFEVIEKYKGGPFQRDLLIHSQTYNIFFIQILEFIDSKNNLENQSMLLRKEVDRIFAASKIIDSNLVGFVSVKALAQEVGINTHKLQNGFKELFGKTVNAYVQDKRLSEASTLIKNTDLSFSEIAERVGISSKSYFSKIFKDKYGLTPSQIRKPLSKRKTV